MRADGRLSLLLNARSSPLSPQQHVRDVHDVEAKTRTEAIGEALVMITLAKRAHCGPGCLR